MTEVSSKKGIVHKWVEKMAVHLHNEENKKLVHLYVIDPILNHVMERVFPYVILTCALFSLLVILVGLTFVILLMKVSPYNGFPYAATAAAVGSFANHV